MARMTSGSPGNTRAVPGAHAIHATSLSYIYKYYIEEAAIKFF